MPELDRAGALARPPPLARGDPACDVVCVRHAAFHRPPPRASSPSLVPACALLPPRRFAGTRFWHLPAPVPPPHSLPRAARCTRPTGTTARSVAGSGLRRQRLFGRVDAQMCASGRHQPAWRWRGWRCQCRAARPLWPIPRPLRAVVVRMTPFVCVARLATAYRPVCRPARSTPHAAIRRCSALPQRICGACRRPSRPSHSLSRVAPRASTAGSMSLLTAANDSRRHGECGRRDGAFVLDFASRP